MGCFPGTGGIAHHAECSEEETAGQPVSPLDHPPGGNMKRVSVILVATASTLVLSAASWRIDRPLDPRESHLRREVARLRAHFDSVDTELRTRDVLHLSVAQRASRTKLIAWLREYRDGGRFPQNDRFRDRRVPFFRDSQETLCAMAYLIDRSGRGDIVDHIAKTRNNAYIREITDDGELVAWLDASGLRVSEAARIQPAYDGDPNDSRSNRANRDYALLSVGLGGSALVTLGFNIFSPTPASAGSGLVAGMATIMAGVARINDDGGTGRVAKANVAVGSVAVIAGVRTLFAMRSATVRAQKEASRRDMFTAAIAPDVVLSPNATRFGLRVRARF